MRKGPASTGSKPTSRIRSAATFLPRRSSPQYTRLGRFALRLASYTAKSTSLGTVLNARSEEHTSELQSPCNLVCRLLLEKKRQQGHLQLIDADVSALPHQVHLTRYAALDHQPVGTGHVTHLVEVTPCV